MAPYLLALTAIFVFLASLAANAVALRLLRHAAVFDRPNQRSSHRKAVPRGGGVGFLSVAIIAIATLAVAGAGAAGIGVLAGALIMVVVSFIDDVRKVPPWARLAAQIVAVTAGISEFPGETAIMSDELPIWLDRSLVALGWLWFINLFNFMDGIDGLAASEAAVIGAGLVLLHFVWPGATLATGEATVILAAALGFLALNWHPARLFMGDVGSTGLGFLLGWLLIDAIANGFLAAALILPMFFVLDATSTIVLRAIRRRPLMTAHRDHAYHQMADRGFRHDRIVLPVVLLGVLLTGLAAWSPNAGTPALLIAMTLTVPMILWMRKPRAGGSSFWLR